MKLWGVPYTQYPLIEKGTPCVPDKDYWAEWAECFPHENFRARFEEMARKEMRHRIKMETLSRWKGWFL